MPGDQSGFCPKAREMVGTSREESDVDERKRRGREPNPPAFTLLDSEGASYGSVGWILGLRANTLPANPTVRLGPADDHIRVLQVAQIPRLFSGGGRRFEKDGIHPRANPASLRSAIRLVRAVPLHLPIRVRKTAPCKLVSADEAVTGKSHAVPFQKVPPGCSQSG